MTIKIGDTMPSGTFKTMTKDGPQAVTTDQLFKGKTVVLVYPVDKWLLMLLHAILGDHAEVRNLGDVRWLATEDRSVGKGTGRHIACFILRAAKARGETHVDVEE